MSQSAPPSELEEILESQARVGAYVLCGTLGMLFWDVLTNLGNDYKLLFKRGRIGLPTIVYFASRLTVIAFELSQTLFYTTPIPNCHVLNVITEVFFAVAICCISFLFFLRLRAIYLDNRVVVIAFFLLFAGNAAAALLAPAIGFNTETVTPGTGICAFWKVNPPLIFAMTITSLVYDTAVFLAIAIRVYRISLYEFNASAENGRSDLNLARRKVWSFMRGKNLSSFLGALLHDGQLFYLMSFFMSITLVILLFTPSVNLSDRIVLLIPYVAVMNCIACYVFRHVRLGNIPENSLSTVKIPSALPGIRFGTNFNLNASNQTADETRTNVAEV